LSQLSPTKPDADGSTASGQEFEGAYRELQQVVARLEDGGLGLEEAVQLFERGSQLVQVCQQIVDAAELRVTRLAAESGTPLPDPQAQR
jgi:exodeoxyribonuclease VII small subunit